MIKFKRNKDLGNLKLKIILIVVSLIVQITFLILRYQIMLFLCSMLFVYLIISLVILLREMIFEIKFYDDKIEFVKANSSQNVIVYLSQLECYATNEVVHFNVTGLGCLINFKIYKKNWNNFSEITKNLGKLSITEYNYKKHKTNSWINFLASVFTP
jgi:hypothetical protein